VKPDIHPEYRTVVYVDNATGDEWVSRSTMKSKETKEVDGEDLPLIRLEISSSSHPFWTGKMRELDTDGKIDRFRRRYGGKKGK
jgi:large subunit ribosomal protein L31